MTDDELSELEEFIDLCCKEAVREGYELQFLTTFNPRSMTCCPLGAVGRDMDLIGCGSAVGLSSYDAADFAASFDGDHMASALSEMGARFRARFLAGEYDRERCK